MFNSIDPNVFADPGFKEDAVREEIVAPLLRRLGYLPSGPLRVQRSKSLVHPFVRIGTRQHPVNIIPDYTLYSDEKAILILDAKAPWESITKSANVEQAYSYAIHPEIRCRHFALCNGRQLAVFSVDEFDPLLVLPFERFESDWAEIERFISARYLLTPQLRDFHQDLGIFLSRLGMAPDSTFTFLGSRLQFLARMDDDGWTATASIVLDTGTYMGSFDFPDQAVMPMLSCLPASLAAPLTAALSRAPFTALLDLMVEVDWTVKLGTLVSVEHESLIPLSVTVFSGTRFNTEPVALLEPPPFGVFSLRKKFDELVAQGMAPPQPDASKDAEHHHIYRMNEQQIAAASAKAEVGAVIVIADSRDEVGRHYIQTLAPEKADQQLDAEAVTFAERGAFPTYLLSLPRAAAVEMTAAHASEISKSLTQTPDSWRVVLIIAAGGTSMALRSS